MYGGYELLLLSLFITGFENSDSTGRTVPAIERCPSRSIHGWPSAARQSCFHLGGSLACQGDADDPFRLVAPGGDCSGEVVAAVAASGSAADGVAHSGAVALVIGSAFEGPAAAVDFCPTGD